MSNKVDFVLKWLRSAADNDTSWPVDPSEAVALIEEIERLRTNAEARERAMRREADLLRATQRAVDVLQKKAHVLHLWAEEAARAENANAEDAKKERAAVVAWLRGNTCGCHDFADAIERGEHRREEEPARAEGFGVRLATVDELVEMGLLERPVKEGR